MANFPDYSLPGIDPNMTPEQHHAQYLQLLRERDKRDVECARVRAMDERVAREQEEYSSLRLPASPGQCGTGFCCIQLGTNVVCVLPAGHREVHSSRALAGHSVTWEHTTHEETPDDV